MDATLFTLVTALIAAAGCAIVAWRAADEQRRRSAARVAALSAAIDDDSRLKPAPTTEIVATPVNVSGMFTTAPGAAVTGRPLIKAAVAAAMMVALVVVVAMANRDHGDVAAATAQSAPLELMSMRHARAGNTLTVSGVVRNPRAGDTVASVDAVVLAFNRQGAVVKTAEAPLDLLTLGPGEESPFVVTLPDVGDIGRYRVSFRTGDRVVRHVDRRAAQVALNVPAN